MTTGTGDAIAQVLNRAFFSLAILFTLIFSEYSHADPLDFNPDPVPIVTGCGGAPVLPDGSCDFSGGGGDFSGGGGGSFGCDRGLDGNCVVQMPCTVILGPDGPVYQFCNIAVFEGIPVTIDPVVAIGFTYMIGTGDPNFASVMLPAGLGDSSYDILLADSAGVYGFVATIAGGDVYTFGGGGVDRFRVMGIETSAGVDPADQQAFQTVVTFAGGGQFSGTMTAITADVPEPSPFALLALGAAAMFGVRRRAKAL